MGATVGAKGGFDDIDKTLTALKQKLYAKFGSSINLEDSGSKGDASELAADRRPAQGHHQVRGGVDLFPDAGGRDLAPPRCRRGDDQFGLSLDRPALPIPRWAIRPPRAIGGGIGPGEAGVVTWRGRA